MTTPDGWTTSWLAWLLQFAVIEGGALLNKAKGDTLSEHVWSWFSIKEKSKGYLVRRGSLVVFLGWLVTHFLSGGRLA